MIAILEYKSFCNCNKRESIHTDAYIPLTHKAAHKTL